MIRETKAIQDKVTVVGLISKVTAVGHVHFSFFVFGSQTLIIC